MRWELAHLLIVCTPLVLLCPPHLYLYNPSNPHAPSLTIQHVPHSWYQETEVGSGLYKSTDEVWNEEKNALFILKDVRWDHSGVGYVIWYRGVHMVQIGSSQYEGLSERGLHDMRGGGRRCGMQA